MYAFGRHEHSGRSYKGSWVSKYTAFPYILENAYDIEILFLLNHRVGGNTILGVDEMHPKHAGQFYYFLEPKDAKPYVLRGELKKGPKGHFEVTMFAQF